LVVAPLSHGGGSNKQSAEAATSGEDGAPILSLAVDAGGDSLEPTVASISTLPRSFSEWSEPTLSDVLDAMPLSVTDAPP